MKPRCVHHSHAAHEGEREGKTEGAPISLIAIKLRDKTIAYTVGWIRLPSEAQIT